MASLFSIEQSYRSLVCGFGAVSLLNWHDRFDSFYRLLFHDCQTIGRMISPSQKIYIAQYSKCITGINTKIGILGHHCKTRDITLNAIFLELGPFLTKNIF